MAIQHTFGADQTLTLSEGQQNQLSFSAADIKGMRLGEHGSLIIGLKDGHTVTITNFHALAGDAAKLALADGTALDAKALEQILAKEVAPVTIAEPAANAVVIYELLPGQKYHLAFDPAHTGGTVTEKDGSLVITFGDHGQIVLKNFDAAMNGGDSPLINHDNSSFLSLADFLKTMHVADAQHTHANDDMADAAQKLAGIEPAAGGNGGGGGAGGHDFNSQVDPAGLNSPPPTGPIGETELNFGLPFYPQPLGAFTESTTPPGPHITINGGPPDAIDAPDAIVKEDGSITIPITASIGSGAPANDVLTVTVTGIPGAAVGTFSSPIGTYDAAHGTWTVTLPAGHDLNTTFTFTPFPNSDADFSGMHATASQFDPATGTTQTAGTNFHVTVDAVADIPTITADNPAGNENTAIAVHIAGAVTDLDGSESVTGYTINGVPAGFSFNHGTDLGGGVWSLSPSDVTGLTMSAPANFYGSLSLGVTVNNAETTLSGNEVDLSDNTNHASTDFSVTWNPIAFPPTVEVNNGVHDAIVKEDGTITVPVTATLDPHDSPNAVLTVTVTGIDNDAGTFSAPIGTYTVDPATHIGTWTYTAAPGTDVSTSFTFTPNHDSDVDFANLHATATAFEPASSTSASSTADAYVTTDAVADVPTIAVHDTHGAENTTVAVSISGAVTDTDGSETVTGYQVSGVPAGFSFNHGTDLGGGVWSFSTTDVTGLTMSSPTNYTGTVNLTATVLNAETSLSGNEADLGDNTNHADATFSATWDPIAFPPTVSVNNGVHDAVVKEDGSITIPVTATLNPLDSPNAVLTVTVTGIHNDAGTFSAPIGTYTVDPATHIGTWTVTLAPGADLSTAFTFTPVHNGDFDFGSLNATATAYEPATATSASSTASAYVTTDAVADVPDLTASTPGGEAGHTVALHINTAVTDTDGSEVIDHLNISNLPAGATLTAGTHNADGSWTLTTAQLTGLGINLPHGLAGGTYTLNVESVSHELNTSGGEPDLTDNYNHADVSVALNVTANPSPVVTDAASTVDETNLAPATAVSSTITANFGIDAPGSFAASNTFSAGGSLAGGALTSDGHAVTVTESGNTYTGTADGHTVFTLALGTNGAYTFTLDGTLDHADHSNPNDAIQLNFGVTATDSDGDHGTGTIHVTVLDDAPTAHNDVNSFFANIGHTSGNVITGAGEVAGGADTLSHDAANDVTQVQFGTHIVNVPTTGTATIDGTYGELVISADGSYIYTLGAGGTAGGGGTTDTAHHFTGDIFPSSLPEGVAITTAEHADLGELHSNMVISANTSVTGTITFDGAGYNNSLGEFTIAADGTLQAAQMIAPSITGTGTSFSATAGSGAAELGFFLVANGFNTNGSYSGLDFAHGSLNFVYDYGQTDQRAANVTDAGAHVSLVFTDGSHHDTVIGGPIYFTTDRGGSNSLNADGVVHTISGVDGTDASGSTLKIGFEDLPNGGDNDYNDTVFTVQLTDHATTPPGSDQFVYTLTDGDGDSSKANLTFNTLTPPTITITVNHGNPITSDASVQSPDAVVKENHSITVPVTATLSNPSSAGEALTVIVSGIPNTVGTVTAADGGVYDAAHGTITWTLAPGAALNSSITFTPTAFSDTDFGNLHVTATAHDALSGTVTASSNIYVTTDAVAEVPGLTASGASEEAGHTTALNITTHEVDPDGSEVISGLTVSGLPAGATLNHGTFDAVHNVWNLSQTDLTGLTVTTAHGTAAGNYTLTVTSTSTETTLSGHEVDFTDNSATATTAATLAITGNPSPIVSDASSTVDESNMAPTTAVSSTITANFGIDAPGTFAASNIFSSGGSEAGGVLTSHGYAVTVTEAGNIYTGTANGHTVFTLAVGANGAYTFTLDGALDHADPNNPNDAIQLNFGVNATDSDGDTAAGTVHVTVLDDAPHITHVDDLLIANNSGLYTGAVDVSGIADGINHFVLSALNGQVPAGLTYTVYAAGDTLPAALLGDGITAPGAGGSLLVAQLSGSGGVFFTLGIDAAGHYTFDLITPNPSTVTNVDFTTAPPGNYPTGIYYDVDTHSWSQTNPGGNDVYIHGNGSVNPSGQGIGIGNNQFEPGESITFDFAHEVSSASVSTVRAAGNTSWDLGVSWIAYDHGTEVAHGTTTFTGASGTFTFAAPSGVSFDSLVLDGLTHAQDSASSDSAKFTIADLSYNQTYLPNELDLGFNVKVYDGDGDSDSAPLSVIIAPPVLTVGTDVSDTGLTTTPYLIGNGHGTVTGGAVGDILVGDSGGQHLQSQTHDYNVVLMLDVSGSMGSASDHTSKLYQLEQAVDNLLSTFHGYTGGAVNVEIISFDDHVHANSSFTVTGTGTGFANAETLVNNLSGGGTTNYEAPLQAALTYLHGSTPIAGATDFSYFVTDGEPNAYLDNSGNVVNNASAATAMGQILGSDGTNEVGALQAYGTVTGVGINVTSAELANISQIDSSGHAINVVHPTDLTATLQASSPLNLLDAVGGDHIVGGSGNDLIFGDTVDTDTLAHNMGLTDAAGAGWQVFTDLENGHSSIDPGWTRADTVSYITGHAAELGAETLGGGAGRTGGNDVLEGGTGNDVIFGQEGNDVITGGAGNDLLYGGSGADKFVFEATTAANGVDNIMDFNAAQGDKLDLSLLLSASNPTQATIDNFVHATSSGGNTTISVNVAGDGIAAHFITVAVLHGVAAANVDDLLSHGNLVA